MGKRRRRSIRRRAGAAIATDLETRTTFEYWPTTSETRVQLFPRIHLAPIRRASQAAEPNDESGKR